MLWDIAGNMLSKTLYNNYLKGAHGVFLVCDAVRPETYDSIIQELEGDLQKIKDKTKMFVIINKADLLTDENRSAILAEKSYDFLTSAKVGENVEEAFRQMAAEIVNQ
jgi:50S ribosomal subunit-associated GTPase HflX